MRQDWRRINARRVPRPNSCRRSATSAWPRAEAPPGGTISARSTAPLSVGWQWRSTLKVRRSTTPTCGSCCDRVLSCRRSTSTDATKTVSSGPNSRTYKRQQRSSTSPMPSGATSVEPTRRYLGADPNSRHRRAARLASSRSGARREERRKPLRAWGQRTCMATVWSLAANKAFTEPASGQTRSRRSAGSSPSGCR